MYYVTCRKIYNVVHSEEWKRDILVQGIRYRLSWNIRNVEVEDTANSPPCSHNLSTNYKSNWIHFALKDNPVLIVLWRQVEWEDFWQWEPRSRRRRGLWGCRFRRASSSVALRDPFHSIGFLSRSPRWGDWGHLPCEKRKEYGGKRRIESQSPGRWSNRLLKWWPTCSRNRCVKQWSLRKWLEFTWKLETYHDGGISSHHSTSIQNCFDGRQYQRILTRRT